MDRPKEPETPLAEFPCFNGEEKDYLASQHPVRRINARVGHKLRILFYRTPLLTDLEQAPSFEEYEEMFYQIVISSIFDSSRSRANWYSAAENIS